jgi:PleD family two-component response regulator
VTPETRDAPYRAAPTDFLTKPLERTEVLLRTRNLLETRFLTSRSRTRNRSLEAKLSYQAFHDSLTGLANRALFRDRLQHAVSRGMRDVDRFAVSFWTSTISSR